jgi:hypothetical protein
LVLWNSVQSAFEFGAWPKQNPTSARITEHTNPRLFPVFVESTLAVLIIWLSFLPGPTPRGLRPIVKARDSSSAKETRHSDEASPKRGKGEWHSKTSTILVCALWLVNRQKLRCHCDRGLGRIGCPDLVPFPESCVDRTFFATSNESPLPFNA